MKEILFDFYRILSNAGEVLAYSGNDEKKFTDVISAITNNMWLMIQTSGEAALNEDYLDYVLIQCTVCNTIRMEVINS